MNIQRIMKRAATAILLSTISAFAQTITIDPSTPVNEFTSLAEWETDGEAEGWAENAGVVNAAVTNGAFQGEVTTGDPQVSQIFTNGFFPDGSPTPDLDDPQNKTIEIRVQVETGAVSRLDVFYGTTTTPGINPSRRLEVPAAQVATNGEFRVYQIRVEDVTTWQGHLERIRFDPYTGLSQIGKSFAIDYLRIGSTVVPSNPVLVDNTFTVEFQTDPDKTYELQSTSTIESNAWSAVTTAVSTGGVVRLVDANPAETEKAYRVEIK